MTSIKKQIQQARPRLKVVSPLAYWTVLIMAWFNIALGFSFLFLVDQARFVSDLIIVNGIFGFEFWGILFTALGALKLYSLHTNNWNLARKTLFLGVSIKAAWMIALILRVLITPGTFMLTLLWVAIALLQMGAYIWFMPPAIGKYKQTKLERDNE